MITTERLLLRPLTLDDAEAWHAVWGDPEVIWWGAHRSVADTEAFVAEVIQRTAGREGLAWFAIILRENDRLIGDIALEPAAWDPQRVEIGWHLARDAQGRGYATEAAAAVVQHAATIGLARVEASIVPTNLPSRRVAEHLGMAVEYQIVRAGMDHDVWVLDLGE